MASSPRAALIARDGERVDLRALARLGTWGLAAVLAVALAVSVGRSELGTQRATAALAAMTAPPGEAPEIVTAQLAARALEADRQVRQLSDTVRLLAAERAQFAQRVVALERSIGDLTGSVSRIAAESRASDAKAASPAAKAGPSEPGSGVSAEVARVEVAARPEIKAVAPPVPYVHPDEGAPALITGAAAPATAPVPLLSSPPAARPANASDFPRTDAVPVPRPAPLAPTQVSPSSPRADGGERAEVPDSIAYKTEFGVDLGPALSLARLRARWNTLQANHAPLFDRLRPLVALREPVKGGPIELRLVVGPLTDAAQAIQLCAALAGTQFSCQPAAFEGQRLALR